MKNKVQQSIKRRIEAEISSQNPLKYLKEFDTSLYINSLISIVYLYTRPKRGHKRSSIYMAEIISAIGHGIRNKLKQKRNSALAAKTGGFLLYTFEELGMVEAALGQGVKGHATYIIQVVNDEAISSLWNSLDPSQIEKLPSEKPYTPWTTSKHPIGMSMVKTGSKEVLEKITVDTHPIVFNNLNRAQAKGWNINKEIYTIHLWALRNKTDAFAEIWELNNQEAKVTKLREAKTIGDIAKKFLDKTFYHLYYYDFRGRMYPTTAYLHEQGSDLARGLLLRSEKKAIGKDGLFWLMVWIASNWAGDSGHEDGLKTDKIPLKERYLWSVDNEEILLSYAESPKINQGWMKAEKPWQFLAACNELMKFRIWQMTDKNEQDEYAYESHLECYIDGSNNGCQHLAALTKDEVTAPHVNLVPLELPGDLYKYVGEHVWKQIKETVNSWPKEEVKRCEKLIDNLIDLKKQINEAELRSDRRSLLIEEIKDFKLVNEELLAKSAIVYWNRITSPQQRRKIVKRNVMTLPYGGTAYGLGEQQILDAKKHGIELLMSMEHRWGAYMGRTTFEDCKLSLRRPMQLLSVFEAAGKAAEEAGKFLSWTVPLTNFPVVQNYVEGQIKKVYVQYGPPKGERTSTGYYENTLQISICFIEVVKPSKGKQSQSASPNAIHSLDAAHLALTVAACDFPISTIHDSFGCLLADMPKLFINVRKTFVDLYSSNPLSIIEDMHGDTSTIDFGTLDVTSVLESEYCFS